MGDERRAPLRRWSPADLTGFRTATAGGRSACRLLRPSAARCRAYRTLGPGLPLAGSGVRAQRWRISVAQGLKPQLCRALCDLERGARRELSHTRRGSLELHSRSRSLRPPGPGAWTLMGESLQKLGQAESGGTRRNAVHRSALSRQAATAPVTAGPASWL